MIVLAFFAGMMECVHIRFSILHIQRRGVEGSSCWEDFGSFLPTSKSLPLDESPCLSPLKYCGINKSI